MAVENYEALLQGNVSGIGTPNGVFIAEAKRGSLKAHIPQLIGEMYGSVMRCGCVGVSLSTLTYVSDQY